jgi:hypothetical protein
MRKNLNKLVAVAIGVSVISGSIIPAFASDTATQNTGEITSVQAQTIAKPLLTLDNAIKAATSNSETLKLDEQKISYQDKINDVNEKVDDANQKIKGDTKDLDKDTRDITLKQLKQQRDFDEDKLIQKTTKAYNDIVTSQMKIDKSTKLLELKNKELSDTKLKKNLGLMTSVDLSDMELKIQNLQNQQKLSVNTLKDAQDSFKVLTGTDITKYTLEQDIKYDEFKIDGSVDEYLDNVIDNYQKYSTDLIKLNKDYFNDKDHQVSEDDVNKANEAAKNAIKPSKPSDDASLVAYKEYLGKMDEYNTTIGSYTGMLSLRLAYLNTKLGIYTQETSLNEAKKNYKEALKTIYTNLIATEDSITYLKSSIELNNKKLSTIKLKYDLGMVTKSEYNTEVANSADLDIQLRSTVDSYNTLKEKIQKPWLAF